MAALFTGASTQYLINATTAGLPSTGYPFTVGMWINLTAVDNVVRDLFAISDTATTNNLFVIRMAGTETFGFAAQAGGTSNTAALATVVVAQTWNFLVARAISATNRKIAALYSTGATEHATSATSRAPAGLDTMTLGALSTSAGILEPWDGRIGEFWLTNTDIQADGAQLLGSTLQQLAYGGPFSIPHIAKDIVEYRSFRKHPVSDGDLATEVFHGKFGRQTWTNTNGVTIGAHPPLPYWYRKPGQYRRVLTI
jgi:hypothetical protein